MNKKLDIDQIIDDYYGYIYVIVKNSVSIAITDEDIEEIISDVFVAIWKNSKSLLPTISIKSYLAGIAKNVIRNKYRKTELNYSISDYENNLIDNFNIDKITEENEQEKIIQETLKELKSDEYEIFILFYYESRSVKEIAKILSISESNVKVRLSRARAMLKEILKEDWAENE